MKRSIIVLIMYLLIFTALFFLSLYNYAADTAVFEIGLSTKMTNLMVMILSVLGVAKSVWHIYSAH